MTIVLERLTDDEVSQSCPAGEEAGCGALETGRGRLPLKAMDVRGRIDGLLCQISLSQTYVNTFSEPLEATYIFPLPDRAAVTHFRMEVNGRVVEGLLKERGQARREYSEAIEKGQRAAITEEERPGVFTLRVGNLLPGEEATIRLTLAGPLPYSDGEATFRFPLVVAPRYIPGSPLPGDNAGQGIAPDTDAVPDASRISPPVLLPGFPNPVRLSMSVDVMPSALSLVSIRSSLHAVEEQTTGRVRRITLQPGARLDRDFILRLRLDATKLQAALGLQPDGPGAREGTFLLTVVPPVGQAAPQPRDVVFVLDRSGSMGGWKMIAARRALGRMVDTLLDHDRFTVLAFDDVVDTPPSFAGLVDATDRQRFRAIEFLAKVEARNGTEMMQPLTMGVDLLASGGPGRDRVLVLITDGQVGNEDQILHDLGPRLRGMRVFCLGIDQAVNAAFLRRLAEMGGGACELVESEDRLDEVMEQVHRRVGQPVLTKLRLEPAGLRFDPESLVPGRLPDVFAGAPVQVLGRYSGQPEGAIVLGAREATGQPWQTTLAATASYSPALGAVWARGQVRKLEDRYAIERTEELEKRIVATSLRFGVLSRFTAFVAVDRSAVVNAGGEGQQIVQAVEMPAGWENQNAAPMAFACLAAPAPAGAASVMRSGAVQKRMLAKQAESAFDGLLRSAPESQDSLGDTDGESVDSEFMGFDDEENTTTDFDPLEEERRSEAKKDRADKAKKPSARFLKQTAKELLALLRQNAAADVDTRRRILTDLTPRLRQLSEDLSAVGQSLPGMDRFGELLRELEGDLADDSVVMRLWGEADQVLEVIAGKGRAKFWA